MLASHRIPCLSSRLVLLVDSDADVRRRYRRALEGIGYDVDEAEDGRDALAMAFSRRPSLIVTQTRLAFIDGYELCALLRRDRETSAARIVVLSEDTHPLQIERARSVGADARLIAPCMPDILVAEIQRLGPRRGEVRQSNGDVKSKPLKRRRRLSAIKAFDRFHTTRPPLMPPVLPCPSCDGPLQYVRSHVGGVSARHSEQWDYFECPSCGTFQYRQRTRKLRRVGAVHFFEP
jgi:two-component system, chemotaxis family, chemotaxis protein CheY